MHSLLRPKGPIAALCAALPVLLSTGCIGPRYERPTVTTPSAFREATAPGAGWKLADPADTAFKGTWWRMYNDSLLNSLECRAVVSNQNIAASTAQYREACAMVKISRAGYFPTIDAQASYAKQRQQAIGGASSGARIDTSILLQGTASWAPDIWGKVTQTVRANSAAAQASAADLAALTLSVQGTLAQDYFQIRVLDIEKRLLDSSTGEYRTFLDLTNNRRAGGIASDIDVAEARTQLEMARAQAIDLGVQRSQLEHAVATLLGIPASQFTIDPDTTFTGRLPLVPLAVPSALLERRPDIAASERTVAAANAQIGVARTAWFPDLTLNASGGWESSKFTDWFNIWSFGGSLAEAIFEGGLRKAQIESARAAYEATVANYRQTVLTAFQQVEDNLAALRILQEEAIVQDSAVAAAAQSTALTVNRYKQGIASALDVINTSTIWLSDRKAAITVLGNRLAAQVALIEAMGGGWETK